MTSARGNVRYLRARTASGLNVQVEAGWYVWNGAHKYWAGGSIDISGHAPAAGNKVPVLVGIDGDANAGAGGLVSSKGTEVGTGTAPTDGALFDDETIVDELEAASDSYVWVAMVPLTDGQTDVDDQEQIVHVLPPAYGADFAGGGGASYVGLSDTPGALSGDGGKYLRVNVAETTLEHVAESWLEQSGGELSGKLTINGSADEVQLTVQGDAGQTANILEIQDDGGNSLMSVAPSGKLTISPSSDEVPLTLNGVAGQTANMLEVKDDGGSDLLTINPDGDVLPGADFERDIGASVARWRRGYNITTLSNKFSEVPSDANAQLYDAGTTTFPSGWTEDTAPSTSTQDNVPGFWTLNANSSSTGWDYKRQTHEDIESLDSNAFFGVEVLNMMYRYNLAPIDFDFYFGLYADDGAGDFDPGIYVRALVQWDSTGSVWRVRGESGDGSSAFFSAWHELPTRFGQSLYLRPRIQNGTSATARVWLADAHIIEGQRLIHSKGFTVTWGTPWLRYHFAKSLTSFGEIQVGGHDWNYGS